MTSSHYYKGNYDAGGIDINKGVNNKAVYLMVDGGSFNGETVSLLGWDKTGDIYYYALTHLLTSGSDYADLYVALDQACKILASTNQSGITSFDCQQARAATDAVEMDHSPASGFNPDTSNTCPTGTTKNPNKLFFDDFENGYGNWNFGAIVGNSHWGFANGFASSGRLSLYGYDYDPSNAANDQISDSYAVMKNDFTAPTGATTYLFFRHAFGFEIGSGHNYDGGVLEYSIDQGATWKDAKGLFYAGKNYNGTIYKTSYTGRNPLGGRGAFVDASHGYVSSRYNLSSLSGKNVRFRWRLGTDYSGSNLGWVVDDVEVYSCVGSPGVPSLLSPADKSLTSNYLSKLDWKDAANANHYWLQVAYDPNFSNLLIEKKNLIPLRIHSPTRPCPITRPFIGGSWLVNSIWDIL